MGPGTRGEDVHQSVLNFFELNLQPEGRSSHRGLQHTRVQRLRRVLDDLGHIGRLQLSRQQMSPIGGVLGVQAQPDTGGCVHLFERHPNDARQEQRIELRLPMQNLAGNAQSQLHHLALYFLKVLSPISCELGESSRYARAIFRQCVIESFLRFCLALSKSFCSNLIVSRSAFP